MVSSVHAAGYSAPAAQVQKTVAPPSVAPKSDGADKENDGDSDDVGATTPNRGQNLNINA